MSNRVYVPEEPTVEDWLREVDNFWLAHRPKLTRQLRREGKLDETLQELAERADQMYRLLRRRGSDQEQARELVMYDVVLVLPEGGG